MRILLIGQFILALCMMSPVFAQENGALGKESSEDIDEEYRWLGSLNERLSRHSFEFFVSNTNYAFSEWAGEYSNVKEPLLAVLQSETLTRSAYDWIFPHLKARWNALTMHEKNELITALQHGRDYLENFSMEKEDAYFNSMKDIQYPIGVFGWSYGERGESLFTRRTLADFYDGNLQQPHPFHHPYRRVETFLYRRIKEGVSKTILQNYLNQFLNDFKLPQDVAFATDKESGAFKNGKPDGVWQFYKSSERHDLVRTDSGSYVNGLKEGIWVKRGTYDPSDTTWETYEKGKKVKTEYHSYWKTTLSFVWIVDLKEKHRVDRRFAAGKMIKEQIFPFKFNVK